MTKANIPNLLTYYRLLATVFFGLVYVIFPSPTADIWALFFFVTGAITDYLDGYLARKWEQVSELGRMLDPIADKAIVLIALAILMGLFDGYIYLTIPVIFIIFREVLVSGMREFLGDKAKGLQVTKLAKWKTMLQMVAIALLIFAHLLLTSGSESGGESALVAGLVVLWASTIVTVITGADYFQKAIKLLGA